MQEPPITTLAQKRLETALTRVQGLRDRIVDLHLRSGSQAELETRSSRILGYGWDHGSRALVVACDNMRGLEFIARQRPRPVFAHMSLLRTAVDGASLARWIFDPTASARTRASRAYRVTLTDIYYQSKAEQAEPAGPTARRVPTDLPVARRQVEAEKHATAMGISPAAEEESRHSVLAARYVSTPDSMGGGKVLYAILSGAAHGQPWAIQLTSVRIRGPLAAPYLEVSLDDERVAAITEVVLDHLEAGVRDAERYVGVDGAPEDGVY